MLPDREKDQTSEPIQAGEARADAADLSRPRFAVVMIEPPGWAKAHFWYDVCRYLCHGLEALGYDCCIACNEFPQGRTPIVVGFCHLERLRPGLVPLPREVGPYILFQTELVGRNAWGLALSPPEWTTAGDLECWRTVHEPLMRQAAAVWSAMPSNLAPLAEIGIEAEWLPLGYLPAMEEVVAKGSQDIDFLYYGTDIAHKLDMLAGLRARGATVVHGGAAPWMYRNDLIARAKVHLVPHRGLGQESLGTAKVCYLCNQGALCVVEECRDIEPYEGCFVHAPTERWAEVCLETLARPDREDLAAACFERFCAIRFEDALRPLVERFVGEAA